MPTSPSAFPPSPGRLAAGFRGVPPLAVDAAITGAVAVATLWAALRWAQGGPWAAVLGLCASVPLLWRRRAPVRTGAVVGVATTGLALAHAVPPLPYGALVAVYTVAALSPPRLRSPSMAAGGVLLVASLAVPGESPDAFGYVGMAFAVAYALGTGARARRAEIEVLTERARRLEEERAAAAVRERARIARDMHDVLTHSVGIMVVQADAGSLVTRTDPDRAQAAFDAIARTGREAIGQLRRVLGALRSDDADAQLAPAPGLGALGHLTGQFGRAGLEVVVESAGGARPVPADVDIAAYRIVQESLTNTLRHAGAATARVRLRWSPTMLRIEVTDDGPGGREPGTGGGGHRGHERRRGHGGHGGHGLIGMSERVAACGGTLRAGPAQGAGGFTVVATLPLGTPAEEGPDGETGEEGSADAARARRR